MIAYQWTAAFIGLAIAIVILWLVRRHHLHGPYAIWWILVASGVLIVSLFSEWLNPVASLLGISYAPILPLILALGAVLVKILTMDLERTRQEVALRRMAQRLGMLEAEIQRLGGGSVHDRDPENLRNRGMGRETG